MARNQEAIHCPAGEWTELTNADATTITFQVQSGSVKVRATEDDTPPALAAPGWIYHARPSDEQSEYGELAIRLDQLAAGASRLFAMPTSGRRAIVLVDHA